MPQTTLNQPIVKVYAQLKAVLERRGCKVVSEVSPKSFVAYQGSLWGLSPRTAKKTINFTFKSKDDKTVVSFQSRLASDWRNITIIGCVIAFVLAGVCVWMALDLTQFMTDGNPSVWGWIITSHETVRFQAGEAFVNLSWGLAVFLSIIIVLEAAIYHHCSRNIDVFAQKTVSEAVSH